MTCIIKLKDEMHFRCQALTRCVNNDLQFYQSMIYDVIISLCIVFPVQKAVPSRKQKVVVLLNHISSYRLYDAKKKKDILTTHAPGPETNVFTR